MGSLLWCLLIACDGDGDGAGSVTPSVDASEKSESGGGGEDGGIGTDGAGDSAAPDGGGDTASPTDTGTTNDAASTTYCSSAALALLCEDFDQGTLAAHGWTTTNPTVTGIRFVSAPNSLAFGNQGGRITKSGVGPAAGGLNSVVLRWSVYGGGTNDAGTGQLGAVTALGRQLDDMTNGCYVGLYFNMGAPVIVAHYAGNDHSTMVNQTVALQVWHAFELRVSRASAGAQTNINVIVNGVGFGGNVPMDACIFDGAFDVRVGLGASSKTIFFDNVRLDTP